MIADLASYMFQSFVFPWILSISVCIVAAALVCCLSCRRRNNDRQDEYEMHNMEPTYDPSSERGEHHESIANAECQTSRMSQLLSPFKRLEKLYNGEVLNTMHIYFELKILENSSLSTFLEERLHELFHWFKPHTKCCQNTQMSPCTSVQRHGPLTGDQFLLLYEVDPSVANTHQQMDNRGRITQHCICPYKPNTTTDVSNLDVTLICLLKETCRRTPAGHPQWFKDVKRIRNKLFHRGDDDTLSDQECDEWRKILEDAITNIAGTISLASQRGVARRIAEINDYYLPLNEIKEALNLNFAELKHMITSALQNTCVQIGNVAINMKPPEFVDEQPGANLSTQTAESKKGKKKCVVVWQFSTPGEWNVTRMQQKLEQLATIGDFDIEFVYQKCLIVHTKLDLNIILDENQFKDSIEEFLFCFTQLFTMQAPKTQILDVTLSMWLPIVKDKTDDDFQKETAQEVMKEETLATSALQAEDTTHAQAPVNKSQLPRELKQIKQIDISGLFYECTAVDDMFVICDWNNKRLVITDSGGSNVRDIPLSGGPCRITAIDNTTVVVNISYSYIDIINIYSGDGLRRISVDVTVHGLTYSEPHLYLGVDGKRIQVIDLHGNFIKTLPIERNAWCITSNKQSIYYSDYNTISCVTTSGEEMWTLDDPMVKNICGLTTDDTNIYVTCYSHTVFVISPDGTQVRQLLTESDELKNPEGICYNRKLKILMVCNYQGPAFLFNIVK